MRVSPISLIWGHIYLFIELLWTGVAIGLSMRFGVSLGCNLMLNDESWKIFVGESSAIDSGHSGGSGLNVDEALKGGVIRHGITTVVPEVKVENSPSRVWLIFIIVSFSQGHFELLVVD